MEALVKHMTKTCYTCKIEKQFYEFNKSKKGRLGLSSYCKSCDKNRYEENKEKEHSRRKIRYELNKEKEAIYNKNRYEKNKNEILLKQNIYNNKPETKTRRNHREKERFKKDPCYRAINRVRNRIIKFLKNKSGYEKTLGCTFEQFKKHIEALFQPGMTWENYGKGSEKWQIDHKYPISIAYKEGEKIFSKACHYTNLQPLWFIDNMKKSNKITTQYI